MVNLRAVANSLTKAVNPNVQAVLDHSAGSITLPSGKRTPQFIAVPVEVQVQALSYSDLQQVDSLNIQGVRRAIYSNDQMFSIVRVGQKGGDLITFAPGTLPEGDTWLCAHVLERWGPWCKVAVTLQDTGIETAGPSLDFSDPNNSQYFPGFF